MTEQTQAIPADEVTPVAGSGNKYHHGRTPAAWTGAVLAFVGILVGSVGMIPHVNWIVFSIGAAILVLAGVVVVIMRTLGLGAD